MNVFQAYKSRICWEGGSFFWIWQKFNLSGISKDKLSSGESSVTEEVDCQNMLPLYWEITEGNWYNFILQKNLLRWIFIFLQNTNILSNVSHIIYNIKCHIIYLIRLSYLLLFGVITIYNSPLCNIVSQITLWFWVRSIGL